MKKFICLLLIVLMLLPCVGCSNTPVEFSEKLSDGKDCYIDVVEIIPEYVDTDVLFCKAILENGNSFLMTVTEQDYDSYFGQGQTTELAKRIKFSKAVRLNGKADTVYNLYYDSKQTQFKVFSFTESDAAMISSNISERNYAGVEYKEETEFGKIVWADIIYMSRSFSVKEYNSSISTSSIYYCVAADGSTFFLWMDNSDYINIFDNTVNLVTDSPDPLELVNPVRIAGIVENVSYSNYFKFYETDQEDVNAAKIENQPAVEYTESLKKKQKTYVEIKNISAKWQINPIWSTSTEEPEYLVCQAERTDGSIVWIYMHISDFKSQFNKNFTENPLQVIELENTVIYGSIVHCRDIATNLLSKTGTEAIILFESKEVTD